MALFYRTNGNRTRFQTVTGFAMLQPLLILLSGKVIEHRVFDFVSESFR